MKNILENKYRIGNFTSSESVALTTNGTKKESFGKPFFTYIDECNYERKLKRSINTEVNSKPTSWGTLVEQRVFDLLGLDYELCSNETFLHHTIDCWAGSPDALKADTVCDVKSPLTLKSFCQLVQPLYDGLTGTIAMNWIRFNHKDGEKYYWQLVSNSIIKDKNFAELIVYVPYLSELESIRELAQNFDGEQNKFAWINWATDSDLPYLIDGGYYKNLNIIRFEVPQIDKDFLTARVLSAKNLLINNK